MNPPYARGTAARGKIAPPPPSCPPRGLGVVAGAPTACARLRNAGEGFGFSVVTAAGGDHTAPKGIRVGRIIQGSAAARSGALQPHDCLLELNGVCIFARRQHRRSPPVSAGHALAGRTHEEVVELLRGCGESVSIVLERCAPRAPPPCASL